LLQQGGNGFSTRNRVSKCKEIKLLLSIARVRSNESIRKIINHVEKAFQQFFHRWDKYPKFDRKQDIQSISYCFCVFAGEDLIKKFKRKSVKTVINLCSIND